MSITPPFKTPILATLYRLVGALVIVLGILVAGIVLQDAAKDTVTHFPVSFPPVPVAVADVLITCIIALPLFGMAQVIDDLRKAAYHAELTGSRLASEAYEIKKAMGLISDQLKTKTGKDADFPVLKRPSQAASVAPTISCPHCRQRILEAKLVSGMNTCMKCGQEFKVEL